MELVVVDAEIPVVANITSPPRRIIKGIKLRWIYHSFLEKTLLHRNSVLNRIQSGHGQTFRGSKPTQAEKLKQLPPEWLG